MSRRNGGIVGPTNTPVGGIVTGLAGGVWRMNDVLTFVSNSQWPKVPESIDNSCRFNDNDSPNLSKTPSSASSRTTWTWSAWIKRSNITGGQMALFGAKTGSGSDTGIWFESDETLKFFNNVGGTVKQIRTNATFVDSSAWYHIVAVWDSTNSTAGDRMRLYINGVEVTSFGTDTNPGDGDESTVNSTVIHQIGRVDSTYHFDGYMAEVVFIDGQALDATSFGEFNTATGIWTPKKIGQFASASQSVGNNSFYLNFKDSSNLGNDESGLSNDYAVSGIASTDQSTDTCVVNFATWNGNVALNSTMALADGNLEGLTGSNYASNASNSIFSSLGMSAGKFYCEIKMTYASANQGEIVGVGYDLPKHQRGSAVNAYNLGYIAEGWAYLGAEGNIKNNNSTVLGSMPTWGTNDIVGIAIDVDNYKLYFSVNGTFINSGDPTSGSTGTGAISLTADKTYYFACSDASLSNTHKYQLNCGSPAFSISSGNSDANGFGNFEYSVPSGYYALNTTNLNTYG